MDTPVISVVGWHNVGKTTFIAQLVAELKRRGLRVATIKHTRGDFQMDQPGTDTWRYAEAGSDLVVISGQDRLAYLERRSKELPLAEIVQRLPAGIDLIIAEGFKGEPIPKIEIVDPAAEREPIARSEELLVMVRRTGGGEQSELGFSPAVAEVVALLIERGWLHVQDGAGLDARHPL